MHENIIDVIIYLIFGLLVGSFLNVVIYRLPQMMYRSWLHEAGSNISGTTADEKTLWSLTFGSRTAVPENMEAVGQHIMQAVEDLPRFNLMVPSSRCQSCGHKIRWFENIPIFSWIFLRGRCSGCNASISWRYPAIELATGLLFAWCGWQWGLTASGVTWAAFSAFLIAMTMIDWDTTLLPDDLTLPLVWGGLLASLLHLTAVPLSHSVIGAMAGYLFLWSIYWAFRLLTGKEGMGYGDFKLFAALGAWFGWSALIPIILMASVIGALAGIGMKFCNNLREGHYVPFGPFLALAGLTAMIFSPASILRAIGLGA